MGKVKILIVEDETVMAMDMRDILEDIGYEVVDAVIGYTEALEALEKELPDIVLLDIMLGGAKDGIDIAEVVRQKYDLPFIFITSNADQETVSRATATKPNGYLVKPFQASDIFTAIETALSNFAGADKQESRPEEGLLVKDSIFVKTDRLFVKVKISDILWLESEGNYLKVITSQGKHLVRASFAEMLENLPENLFIKVHKSFVAALAKIDAVNHSFIIIEGHEVPLSRNYRDELYKGLKRIV